MSSPFVTPSDLLWPDALLSLLLSTGTVEEFLHELTLRMADQSKLNEDLHATLTSRSVIDQAIGIVMAQQRCPAPEAFALLSRASQNRNIKLHDLAAEIVTTVGGRTPGSSVFEPPAESASEAAPARR